MHATIALKSLDFSWALPIAYCLVTKLLFLVRAKCKHISSLREHLGQNDEDQWATVRMLTVV